ncbi:MAG: capsular polysaccharide biosynthesis protein CapF [Eubacteriales bacterium]|nr:capsular polysaccharide biosynthesis protein CapF [Eubacteriales bacterium]
MKILVTGAKGFVGRNLVETLKNIRDGKDKTRGVDSDIEIFEFDLDTPEEKLEEYAQKADFVYHLAGVNRPKEEKEFMEGNFGFTSKLLDALKKYNNKAPVLITSSIQAALDNPYGRSKKAGEDLMFSYGKENDVKVLVYRLPNVFGKWCRPNYNSAVATFCHNIAHDLPITVNAREHMMTLVYVDDVVDELVNALSGKENREGDYCKVPVEHKIKLGEIADLLYSFKESRETKLVPDMTENSFSKKLYSTYLSYLEPDNFSYKLKMNVDDRGSFTEILRTVNAGQFSVNISKPGITKGQHWHNTKNEKFVVVSGRGLIQLRKIGTDEVINYEVGGDEITVVDMIPGYTHNIINLSDTEDLVTFMWCNECFNPEKPDTFFEEVANV